jgi:hypothetical protein
MSFFVPRIFAGPVLQKICSQCEVFTGKVSRDFVPFLFFKRIGSRDFGTLFLTSLDRFEGLNRASSGLIFNLIMFSCLNFKKIMLMRLRSFRVRNPGVVIIRRIFRPRTANTRPPWDK